VTPEVRALYQETILDHGRRPRNLRRLERPTHGAEGYNPLCGDRFTVEVALDGETIRDLAFEGQGCAISKASASLMTARLKGCTRADAERLFEQFRELVTTGVADEALGKLSVFSGVHEFPARVKCATLAWHTLRAALAGKTEAVSTE
jgi:nitrogen fixation NifU-like protein